jgi:hypothetical protein
VPQDWLAGTDADDGAAVSARAAAEFDGWAPELTALITDTDTARSCVPFTHCRPGTAGIGCPG